MDDNENENELGTFLKVERTADGYIEQDRRGNKHQYVRRKEPLALTIEKLNVRCTIDAQSGAKRMTILGCTSEKIRAIGVTGDYPIFSVTILAGNQPGTAMIHGRYSLGGNSLFASLSINVAATAMSSLVDELRNAKSARVISVAVKEGSFFAADPDVHDSVVLLPWLEEQRTRKTSEDITVEFPLEVAEITVGPEGYWPMFEGFHSGETETAPNVQVSLSSPLGIYYSNSEHHPLQSSLNEARSELSSLRSALTTLVTAVAIGIAFLVVRFWR